MTPGDKKIIIEVDYDDSCYLRIALEDYAEHIRNTHGDVASVPFLRVAEYVNQQVLSQLD